MIIAAGIITRYDWQPDRRFMVRLDIYSFSTENFATDILTSQSFSVEDAEGFVNFGIYAFVLDYITLPVDEGGWGITLAAGETLEIINPYKKISRAASLSKKFTVFWKLDEETGTPRADGISDNDLTEIGTVSRVLDSGGTGTYAAAFDNGNYLEIANSPELVFDADFMIAFWTKTSVSADVPLFSAWDTINGRMVFELWRIAYSSYLELRVHNGVTVDTYPIGITIESPKSTFDHLLLWYEVATSTMRIQFNATLGYSGGGGLTTPILGGADKFFLGAGTNGATGYSLGQIKRFIYGPFNPDDVEKALLFNFGQGQDWPIEELTFPPTPIGTGFVRITSGAQELVAVPIAPVVDATTLVKGIVKLSTSVDVDPGFAVQASDTRLSDVRIPSAHKTNHQDAGTDEISVTGLAGLLANPQTPLSHAASHQTSGADEINVTGLAGQLLETQYPSAHAASHEFGGADQVTMPPVDVTGFFGVLAEPQYPIIGPSDYEACAGDDARLSDARPPLVTGAMAGDTMYYDGTDWIRVPKGTAGQVWTMNAGGTAPEWQ